MRYLDVCAGISASTVAWKPLGWQAAAYSEIEAAPRAVLAHHYPETPIFGRDRLPGEPMEDYAKVAGFQNMRGDEYGPIDLLVGGTPCQDFSVAGLRAGLDGDRGNLSLEFLRLADRARPRWVVWENVPGVLSIDGGRAFGAILGGLGELGYGFAYRVLDAQFFGVPQRRRRVFVVGCAGDWRGAAAVLSERHSLSGHPAPRREAEQGAAGTLAGGARLRGGYSADDIPAVAAFASTGAGEYGPGVGSLRAKGADAGGGSETLVAGTVSAAGSRSRGAGSDPAMLTQAFGGNNCSGPVNVAAALQAHAGPAGRMDFATETFIAHALRGEGFDASEDGTGRGTPLVPVACFSAKDHGADAGDIAPTLRAGGHSGSHANAGAMPAIAYGISSDAIDRSGEGDGSPGQRAGMGVVEDGAPCLRARPNNAVATASAVRRLTPRECERLQGFPDDYTLVPHRGKPMADGPRYKALGNSMAVPVMRWIGERIAAVEALTSQSLAA